MLRLRTSVPAKSARFDVLDEAGDGILAATFIDKGAKSAVQLQLNGLPDQWAGPDDRAGLFAIHT